MSSSEEPRHDELDRLLSGAQRAPGGDADLDALLRIAGGLRGLPNPDFKEDLRAQLLPQASRARWRVPIEWLRAARRRRALVATAAAAIGATAGAAVAAAVVLLVLFAVGDREEGPSQEALAQTFTLTALDADAIGIEPDTAFVLTTEQSVDTDLIRSLLRVEPAVELDVQREDAQHYRIAAKEPFDPGKVYRISLAVTSSPSRVLASWAFQTKSPIRIVQTLPRDQATQVPVNSGIELTLSHDGVQDIASHFEIDPPVEGRFEVHKRVVVFVPEGGLAEGTLYTVTVRAGVGVEGTTDVMTEDVVFQFETGDDARTGFVPIPPFLNFTRRLSEASTLEAPALELYSSDAGAITLPVEVYRYPDVPAFLAALEQFQDLPTWAAITRDSFLAETDGLVQVSSFQADLQRLGDFGDRFLAFPEPLPPGFYLVQVRFQDRSIQSWLQVTDVASYLTVSRDKTLVWVNDLATQGPLSGARLELLGTDAQAETDDQGIAFIDTPPALVRQEQNDYGYAQTETSGHLLITAPDGRSAIVPLGSTATSSYYGGYYAGFYGYSFGGDEYWHFVSTDRPLYLPSDTVRFWGVARRREDPPPSETVTVELTGSDYLDYYYQPVRVAETEVTTTPLGSYTGEISFAGLSPGYYQLTVKVGGEAIDFIGVEVQTYTKPAYKIDVVPSKRAVYAGERVDFAITATFFDGSPVPGLRLRYSDYDKAFGELTTDERGEAQVTLTGQSRYEYVDSNYLNLTPVLAEEGEIIGEAYVSVHPASRTFSAASTDIEGGQGVIEGTVHNVDLSRINEGTTTGYDDYLGDPAGNAPVSVWITEVSWRQREVGEYYDFIAKIVRKRYEYDEIRTPLGTFTATTDPGGAFRHLFPVDEEKYYEIDLAVTDAQGREATTRVWLSGRESLFNARSNFVYLTRPGGAESFFGGSDRFAIGDEVVLEMRRGADALPGGGENSYLFYQAQNGVRAYAVQPDSTLRFDFGEGNVPSTTVLAVWFNGRTYLEVNYGYQLQFDPAERELQIALRPDRERYEPGDSATVDVLVTDGSGEPQADAEVNLAVVDEAIFRIQGSEQYVPQLLGTLYQPVGPGILRTYASHQYPSDVQPAERGGDGGPRRTFADIAFFGSVTTDGEGRASVSFDLPDNLTSWRITARGLTEDLKAGTAIGQLPVGLPFFVDVTMNDEYLVSDRPVIKVRSFGRELAAGQQVTFEVTSETLGLTEAARVTAPAFQAARVPLPALREGTHEVLIAASAGEMEDSLVRTIRVVPSRLVGGEGRFYELASGLDIEGSADRPTRLVFSDHERGRYLPLLQQLTWGYGDRVDQMLARDVAAELLSTYFEDVEARGQEFDASLYQTPDNGIALFPYADGDLVLSARVAALASERFGRNGLAAYFLTVTEDQAETRERQIIALYGLAALGEPVLVALQSLAREEDLTWRERLYVGLAAQELGDDPTARALYDALLADFGESRAPSHRLRVGTDQDDILEATSLAAILAAGLGDQLAPALFDYTAENYTKDILVELEQMSYLSSALPRLSPESVRFAYTLNGEREELELQGGETFSLQVTPEELAGLELDAIEGRVGVGAFFTAPLDPDDLALDPDISVTRTYGAAGEEPVILQEGELVQIRLQTEFGPQALDGCYQVSDLLPSGLRPVTRPYAWGIGPTVSYPYRIEGQRVSFCISKNDLRKGASYFARVVNAGEYIAEPVTIQSMKSAESINLSAPNAVEIR